MDEADCPSHGSLQPPGENREADQVGGGGAGRGGEGGRGVGDGMDGAGWWQMLQKAKCEGMAIWGHLPAQEK